MKSFLEEYSKDFLFSDSGAVSQRKGDQLHAGEYYNDLHFTDFTELVLIFQLKPSIVTATTIQSNTVFTSDQKLLIHCRRTLDLKFKLGVLLVRRLDYYEHIEMLHHLFQDFFLNLQTGK